MRDYNFIGKIGKYIKTCTGLNNGVETGTQKENVLFT